MSTFRVSVKLLSQFEQLWPLLAYLVAIVIAFNMILDAK